MLVYKILSRSSAIFSFRTRMWRVKVTYPIKEMAMTICKLWFCFRNIILNFPGIINNHYTEI